MGENLYKHRWGDDFLDNTPNAEATKEKLDKLGFIKISQFSVSKDITEKPKRQAATHRMRNYLVNDVSNKGLGSKVNKEFLHLNKKTNNQFKKWTGVGGCMDGSVGRVCLKLRSWFRGPGAPHPAPCSVESLCVPFSLSLWLSPCSCSQSLSLK